MQKTLTIYEQTVQDHYRLPFLNSSMLFDQEVRIERAECSRTFSTDEGKGKEDILWF